MSNLSVNSSQSVWKKSTPTQLQAPVVSPVSKPSGWKGVSVPQRDRSSSIDLGQTQQRLAQSIQVASPKDMQQVSQKLSQHTLNIQEAIGKLKPTQTVERTGLEFAQEEFRQNSLSDRQTLQETQEGNQQVQAPKEVSSDERQQFFQGVDGIDKLPRKLEVIQISLDAKVAELNDIAHKIELVQTGKGKNLPSLQELDLQRLNTAQQIKNLKQTRDDLGGQLQQQLKTSLTEPMSHSLSLLSRQQLKTEIESAIGAGPAADMLLESTMKSLPNRILDNNSVMIDGVKYTNRTKLAQGGMGAVYSYENPETGKKIVLKQPLNEEAQNEVISELQAHRHAMGSDGVTGHNNMVKLLGSVSSDNGPLIALEYVDGSDVTKFTQTTLTQAQEKGLISDKTADLLKKHMFFGMLQGMEHLKNDRGMTHFDVKGDNFFMTSDGTVKVGDFGLSRTEQTVNWGSKDRRDNPTYLAPELMVNNESQDKQINSQKSDNWSLGDTAYRMFFDKENPIVVNERFMSGAEKAVKKFGEQSTNRILDPHSQKMQIGKRDNIGPTGLNKLINRLMDPDPENRVSLQGAMQSSIFKELFEQDGTTVRPEIKQLFQALNENPQDSAKIQALSKLLDN